MLIVPGAAPMSWMTRYGPIEGAHPPQTELAESACIVTIRNTSPPASGLMISGYSVFYFIADAETRDVVDHELVDLSDVVAPSGAALVFSATRPGCVGSFRVHLEVTRGGQVIKRGVIARVGRRPRPCITESLFDYDPAAS
jgi:hypothetical protein